MKFLYVSALLLSCSAVGSFGGGARAGQARQTERPKGDGGVAPGRYVCYDLTLVLGAGGYRYGYKYMESFIVAAGGVYRREASRTRGKFRYDPSAKAITFLDGPYAEAGRVGRYEADGKSAEERLNRTPDAAGGGTPNIVLHKKADESGDSDWYCSLERK